MKKVISEHLFIFPFSWKYSFGHGDPLFNQHNEIKRKRLDRLENWKEHLSAIETAEDYNEYVYFYKPIRSALYTFSKQSVIVRNYSYASLGQEAFLKIVVWGKDYVLDVDRIDLKLYKTGIGLLCFHILNQNYREKTAIAAINHFSECVYPPLMPLKKAQKKGFPSEIALSLNREQIIKGSGSEMFMDEKLTISPVIMEVLGKPFSAKVQPGSKESVVIEPILGYQMFCCCMYYDAELLEALKQNEKLKEKMDKWMGAGMSETVKTSFLQGSRYLYGINRHMLLGVADQYPCEKLFDQLVQLVLMQRATLLNLSTEIARISALAKSEISPAISSLYEIYVQFINQLYFKEVTEDGEGSMLYDELSRIFKIAEELEQLNFEMDEVHEYALLLEQSASNFKVQLLTIIGAALVLPSFVTGFFGMNIFQQEARHWWRYGSVACWLNSYVLFPILLVIAICSWSKRRTIWSLLGKVLMSILLLVSFSFMLKYGSGL